MTDAAKPAQKRQFYGRRKGKKLRTQQQGAYEGILPAVTLALPAGDAPVEPASFFDAPVKQVWMEIGFGHGEHLAWHAKNNPDVGFIGCEPFINGIAALCMQIGEHGLKNVRIWPDDARLLLSRLPAQSLDRLFIINADPWPKKRHHKRRFIQTEMLDKLHALLKPGAEFRMATDHPDLAEWLVEKTCAHPGFEWQAKCAADWQTRPADLPETKFQNKGLKAGRPTVFLNFTRKG
ncbi:MAG TPA: tRNA (guanosine(46)-N7)-methyltransferase TrmB [Alphaproteobacteria bacterium]|nr:tRNA (guanosine(46)-N7)-methyltransferase TrmB [Rhodospirillaceae bacterium]HRI75422.1 tRNA (guanosine(46)-N7)-methyltransferase TrmB [Alphaproteobacteria bacterium]HRJ66505.1 tRNA (guanosine(46)-N7)-methyltransferase TrmB [Alphaproteobacteria bacterium]